MVNAQPKYISGRRTECGLTLIEVLVAVLVIAVGLLGLAGLQAGALQSNRLAYERTQATLLAYDMADRMRANRGAAINGLYDNDLNTTAANGSPGQPVVGDVADWNSLVAGNLANGAGAVASDAGCTTCVTITIQWQRRNDGSTQTFVYETRI